MVAAINFSEVSRRYGDVAAVDNVELDINEGEFFVLLGPSGSGKTTCLRLVAGFEEPDSGHVALFGDDMTGVAPYRRKVNTVFQDYALFPHLNVINNVAYGLMIKGWRKADRFAAAQRALDMVRLPDHGDRKPGQLSGGQRQRVALARALVNQPQVLLLDEPLGALDLKLREQMQEELKALQASLKITFVFVTHDQSEALSLADRIAIFNDGRVVQVGSPGEIYSRPNCAFVANFVGSSNVLAAEFVEDLVGVRQPASLRPEAVKFVAEGVGGREAQVISRSFLGASTRVVVALGPTHLSALIPGGSAVPDVGHTVFVTWTPESLHVMNAS